MNNTNVRVVTILVRKGHKYASRKVHTPFRMLSAGMKSSHFMR